MARSWPNASRLDRALRQMGFNAYILHPWSIPKGAVVDVALGDLPKTRKGDEEKRAELVRQIANWYGVTVRIVRTSTPFRRSSKRTSPPTGNPPPSAGSRPPESSGPTFTMAQDLTMLGLSGTPSRDDLRRAWRLAAVRLHPDHGGNAEEFKRVRAAYERTANRMGIKV